MLYPSVCERACALVWSVCLFVYVSLCSPEKRDLFKVEFYEKGSDRVFAWVVQKVCPKCADKSVFDEHLQMNCHIIVDFI